MNEEKSIVGQLRGYLSDTDVALIKHAGEYSDKHDHGETPAYLGGTPKTKFWRRILRRK